MNVKKIIAREWLVLLAFIGGGYMIAFVSDYFVQHTQSFLDFAKAFRKDYWAYEPLSIIRCWKRALVLCSSYNFPSVPPLILSKAETFWTWMEHFGEFVFLYGYPLYLIFSSIVWAVKSRRKQ